MGEYEGRQGGLGGCALYIGEGRVLGVDVDRIIYRGTYEVISSARLEGSVTLTASRNGGVLVTGDRLAPHQSLDVPFSLPMNFADGLPHIMRVGTSEIVATFEKIGDIPELDRGGQP